MTRGLLAGLSALALLGGVGASAAYAFGSPRFAITQVDVQGAVTIPAADVQAAVGRALEERVALVFRRRNAFLFDAGRAEEAVRSSFDLESLSLARDGNRVTVTLQEKVSQLVWKSGDARYLVDRQGTAIRALAQDEALPELGVPLPVFQDVNRDAVAVGAAVLRAAEVDGALRFHQALKGIGLLYGTTRVDRLSGAWMSVQTADGYEVLFDPTADPALQAENVRTVISTQVEDPTRLRYVDVRFGDHVYFK